MASHRFWNLFMAFLTLHQASAIRFYFLRYSSTGQLLEQKLLEPNPRRPNTIPDFLLHWTACFNVYINQPITAADKSPHGSIILTSMAVNGSRRANRGMIEYTIKVSGIQGVDSYFKKLAIGNGNASSSDDEKRVVLREEDKPPLIIPNQKVSYVLAFISQGEEHLFPGRELPVTVDNLMATLKEWIDKIKLFKLQSALHAIGATKDHHILFVTLAMNSTDGMSQMTLVELIGKFNFGDAAFAEALKLYLEEVKFNPQFVVPEEESKPAPPPINITKIITLETKIIAGIQLRWVVLLGSLLLGISSIFAYHLLMDLFSVDRHTTAVDNHTARIVIVTVTEAEDMEAHWIVLIGAVVLVVIVLVGVCFWVQRQKRKLAEEVLKKMKKTKRKSVQVPASSGNSGLIAAKDWPPMATTAKTSTTKKETTSPSPSGTSVKR